ncbi:hypothetical protein SRHO_G00220940 [Serrasalmus rhombeus]
MRVHCQECFTLVRPGSVTAYSGTTSKVTELIQSAEGTVGNADGGVAPDSILQFTNFKRGNQEMEDLKTSDLMKVLYQKAWSERSTFGQRDTKSRFPQIPQERRTGHEKKPRCSGTTSPLRLPEISTIGDSFTDRGLTRTCGNTTKHFVTVVGTKVYKMMDLSAFQRFINEPAELRSPGDSGENEQMEYTTENSQDVSKTLQPPKPISKCIRKSTLSKAAAPLYPKPESSLDIVMKGVALKKKDASTIIQPTPPAEPKPRKLVTQRRCARCARFSRALPRDQHA